MKSSMKKLLILSLTGILMVSGVFTSHADYIADNLEILKEEVEKKRELVEETLPAQLEELENVTIPGLERELEEAKAAYEKDLEENPHSVDPTLKIHMEDVESDLAERRRDIDRMKSEIETEKYHLSELEKQLDQRTRMAYDPTYGTDYATGELRAAQFAIDNIGGEWFLKGTYRGWNKLMGGSWSYSSGFSEDLDISFYIDGECVESSLSRAGEHDTETTYAWAVPFDLEYSTVYKIEINGIKFSVSTVGNNGPRSGNGTGTSTGTGNTEETADTATTTVDYPGYYDATLADGIPDQTYYAQASDGGWTVVIGHNFTEYSEYDKNTERGNSDVVKGWLCKDGKWYAFNEKGQQVTGWIPCGGYWYCVIPTDKAETSYMVTGWQELNSKWYYFNTSGQMVANCVVDGYTIGADGVWIQ